MRVHHSKHHQTYTDRLNDAWEQLRTLAPHLTSLPLQQLLESPDLGSLPRPLVAALRNHGGGFLNHAFFWACMAPPGVAEARGPRGPLLAALEAQWGSLAAFQTGFGAAAKGLFGSGWAWLVVDAAPGDGGDRGHLSIVTTANQDMPGGGVEAILGLDVCEFGGRVGSADKMPTVVPNPLSPSLLQGSMCVAVFLSGFLIVASHNSLGAGVLPRISEQACGLRRRLVARCRLGSSRGAVLCSARHSRGAQLAGRALRCGTEGWRSLPSFPRPPWVPSPYKSGQRELY